MGFPWEDKQWYLAHKARWDALESQGWQFRVPAPNYNRIGITIFNADDHYTMYIPRTTPKEIHESLLERCEYHARNYSGRASTQKAEATQVKENHGE